MKKLFFAFVLFFVSAIAHAADFWEDCGGLVDPDEVADVFSVCENLAGRGSARAQFILGLMYDDGEGVAEDNEKAIKWFRLAAKQGDAEAQFSLGRMYDDGEGAAEDNRKAIKWYRLAAKQGHEVAQFFLGVMYDHGEEVTENNKEAIKWYRLAADQGHKGAQNNLGLMYDKGEGVVEDNEEAVKWYRLAADQGHAVAQDNLGQMYLLGEGVSKDPYEAYIWFLLSAANGDEFGATSRDEAENLLSADEIQRANQEAKKRLDAEASQKSALLGAGYQVKKPSFSKPAPSSPAEIAYENGWRSIVVIETDESQGSGVIIRPNVVATNCHLINGDDDIEVYKADNRRAQRDSVHYGSVRYRDDGRDLCLLDVPGLWGIPASIRRANTLLVGESVYAIGAPRGMDYSLSAGIVSQLRSDDGGAPEIQTDAAISPGSSGGGLFDGEGNLVGVVTSELVGEGVSGISFALPADWILLRFNDMWGSGRGLGGDYTHRGCGSGCVAAHRGKITRCAVARGCRFS